MRPVLVLLLVTAAAACGTGPSGPSAPAVHLFEDHCHSLAVWRAAGARDRVVIHVDGHSDLDWLPDAAIERFAAAGPAALERLEHHPYAMDGETYRSIGIWNFLYPAHRMGIVREVVWVVPDGSLADAGAARALVQDLIAGKMQGVSVAEATGFRWDGAVLAGRAAGVPLRIVELSRLEAPDENVLLDIDLDYLTTRSAATQEVTAAPSIPPTDLVRRLRAAGVRTDLATISYSTRGGFLPPAARWVGPVVADALRDPAFEDPLADRRLLAQRAVEAGRWEDAASALASLVRDAPGDAPARYLLSVALAGAGRPAEAEEARAAAVSLDPAFAEAALHEADALWLSGRWVEAEASYRAFLERDPGGEHAAYAMRRLASCLSRTGRDAEAVAMLRRVVEMAPDHADSRMDLAILLRERGDLAGALEQLARAREILPERGTYALARGTTLAMAGRADEALDEFRFAAAARPSWERAQANLAAAALGAGLRDEAASHLRDAMALGGREPATRRLAALLGMGPAGR
jgi:tetratricopeptide (TPR) repeat protein